MTLSVAASAIGSAFLAPPTFHFSLFVPGLRLPKSGGELGPPKPYGKGSLEPVVLRAERGRKIYALNPDGTVKFGDNPKTYAWMQRVAAYARQKRMQLVARGYNPFPYPHPVEAKALFVYERPHTQPNGPPVVTAGRYAQADTDKLQRCIGDAIIMTRKAPFPMGEILVDDNLIVRWLKAERAFVDMIDWGDIPPAAGVFFKITHYTEDPIDINEYM